MDEFHNLGNNISLWEPPIPLRKDSDYASSSPTAPSLIILCTWLGGSTTKRVEKYTNGYRISFPNTPILLLRTVFADISVRTFRQIRDRLTPARDAIRRLTAVQFQRTHEGDHAFNNAYLHIFSHGGCNTALQLAISMRESRLEFPVAKIIFDCCPGDATYYKAYDAAALSLPGAQPANAIGRALLHLPIAAITGAQRLGLMSSVTQLCAQLNDPQIFGSGALRMYLYSRADRMVDFVDVQSHIETARNMGLEVESVMFETSAHCALPMEDATKYWQVIRAFWNFGEVSQLTQGLNANSGTNSKQIKL